MTIVKTIGNEQRIRVYTTTYSEKVSNSSPVYSWVIKRKQKQKQNKNKHKSKKKKNLQKTKNKTKTKQNKTKQKEQRTKLETKTKTNQKNLKRKKKALYLGVTLCNTCNKYEWYNKIVFFFCNYKTNK